MYVVSRSISGSLEPPFMVSSFDETWEIMIEDFLSCCRLSEVEYDVIQKYKETKGSISLSDWIEENLDKLSLDPDFFRDYEMVCEINCCSASDGDDCQWLISTDKMI